MRRLFVFAIFRSVRRQKLTIVSIDDQHDQDRCHCGGTLRVVSGRDGVSFRAKYRRCKVCGEKPLIDPVLVPLESVRRQPNRRAPRPRWSFIIS